MNTETVIKMVGDFFDLTAEDFTPKQLAVITDPREDVTPHWRCALYMIDRDGDAVTVKLMVFTCPC